MGHHLISLSTCLPCDPGGLLQTLPPSGQGDCIPRSSRLIGASVAMRRVRSLIAKVAAKRHPVLVQGETGTGKGLVAREIHASSPWRNEPFMVVDCAALAPDLIESELFGHVRGAFTGAAHHRQGLLARGGGGTLFLDEIAEIPLQLQSRLLRAVEERKIRPLGSNQDIGVEARVVAATSQDLEAAVRQATFRKDLYFRLNVLSIELPALREHRSDIPDLVHHFLQLQNSAGSGVDGISEDALQCLIDYAWPGNVRELDNCIQRALTVASGSEIVPEDLPPQVLYRSLASPSGQHTTLLRELERQAVLNALEMTAGHRARAARLLGIAKTTIYRKLKEYGLERGANGPVHSAAPFPPGWRG